jgi:dynein light chain 1
MRLYAPCHPISSMQLKDWSELDKLASLPELRDVLFVGNPMYEGMDRKEAKLQVLKRLPRLVKIDNEMVIDAEREMASKL